MLQLSLPTWVRQVQLQSGPVDRSAAHDVPPEAISKSAPPASPKIFRFIAVTPSAVLPRETLRRADVTDNMTACRTHDGAHRTVRRPHAMEWEAAVSPGRRRRAATA